MKRWRIRSEWCGNFRGVLWCVDCTTFLGLWYSITDQRFSSQAEAVARINLERANDNAKKSFVPHIEEIPK